MYFEIATKVSNERQVPKQRSSKTANDSLTPGCVYAR